MQVWLGNREEFIDWQDMPTMSEFIKASRNISLGGLFCPQCRSEDIRNDGLETESDPRRIHICNGCGSCLFRSE